MADAAGDALELFLKDGPERIERIASTGLVSAVPAVFRAEAASVARQASGGWTVVIDDTLQSFELSSAMREFRLPGQRFAQQCADILALVTHSRIPELRTSLALLDDPRAAVMSAFFHYFVIHEMLHVEQGLGSNQYKDSDLYMPIVMEADHVADVAGLAIATNAGIPELAGLDARAQTLLLIAVHIAAMYGFNEPGAMDVYPFSRLLVWYVHLARFCKAPMAADLTSITMLRPWIIALPKLIGRADMMISEKGLDDRAADPYPTSVDVVVAYHQEDGRYRIHRAVQTDAERIRRLCSSILHCRFDAVREDLEELLINNPALVPVPGSRAPDVEWAGGGVLDRLDALRTAMMQSPEQAREVASKVVDDFNRLVSAVRSSGKASPAVNSLISEGREIIEMLEERLAGQAGEGGSPARLRRQALSIVEQIVQDYSADYKE